MESSESSEGRMAGWRRKGSAPKRGGGGGAARAGGPTGGRGLPPRCPEVYINSKLNNPLAVLDTPLQKAPFYHQVFALLQLSPQREEARSEHCRLAGQINFPKSIEKSNQKGD